MNTTDSILDHDSRTDIPKRRSFLVLLFGHIAEFLALPFLLMGIIERIEHTQFIPGISMIYWGLLIWGLLGFIPPLCYEFVYRGKFLQYFLAWCFGFLMMTHLLGRLEWIERTQFIPGVAFYNWNIYIGIIALAVVGLLMYMGRKIQGPNPFIRYIYHFLRIALVLIW